MADVQSWVPKGFTEGRHPLITERLEREIAIGGAQDAPFRVVVIASENADREQLDAFFSDHPLWRAYALCPGAWELTVRRNEIAEIAARQDLFASIDVAGRLTGAHPVPSGKTAAVRVSPATDDADALSAAVRELGGGVAGRGPDGLLARLPSDRLATLLARDDVEAIDVAALT